MQYLKIIVENGLDMHENKMDDALKPIHTYLKSKISVSEINDMMALLKSPTQLSRKKKYITPL